MGKSLVSAHGLTAVYLNINVGQSTGMGQDALADCRLEHLSDNHGMHQCLDVIQVMCESVRANASCLDWHCIKLQKQNGCLVTQIFPTA